MRPQLYTKNYMPLRNTNSGRNSLLHGRIHQLVTQYEMIRPENIHRNNIIQTEKTVLVYSGVFVYVKQKLIEKEATYLKVSKLEW